MKSVPLTRVRHADNFVIALHDKGMPSERLLDRAGLPAGILHEAGDDGIISALSMLEFAEISAHDTGIWDLGYWAGLVPLEGYGDFGRRVVGAPTLYGAISTFCREVRGECSEADYFLRHDAPNAWFCHLFHSYPTSVLTSAKSCPPLSSAPSAGADSSSRSRTQRPSSAASARARQPRPRG